jgi:hypothetical protein
MGLITIPQIPTEVQKFILAIGFLAFCSTVYGQDQIGFQSSKYIVDPQIAQQIKRYPFVDTGTLKNSMKIEVTWDGTPFFNQKDLDCYTLSFIQNDTIAITGHMIGQLGWGFNLAIFGDSCIVASFAFSDTEMYKYNVSDSTLLQFISLPSVSQKLILSGKPTFKDGERVAGFVELKSEDFYYILDGSTKKSHIKLTAFFKTSILKTYPKTGS